MRQRTRRYLKRLLAATLALSLAALTGCAARVTYVRGTSEAIPLTDGQTVKIPEGWTGAWMLSDEALSDLLIRLEAKEPK